MGKSSVHVYHCLFTSQFCQIKNKEKNVCIYIYMIVLACCFNAAFLLKVAEHRSDGFHRSAVAEQHFNLRVISPSYTSSEVFFFFFEVAHLLSV